MYANNHQEAVKPSNGVSQYPPMQNQLPNNGPLGNWSTGLCGCFEDPMNCLTTCCCPCVTFGQIAEIVDRGASSCGMSGMIFWALGTMGCSWIYSCSYRTKLRGLYSLEEAPCSDCLLHCCCQSCALCQEYRELKNRNVDPAIGWQANVEMWNRGPVVAPNVTPGMNR